MRATASGVGMARARSAARRFGERIVLMTVLGASLAAPASARDSIEYTETREACAHYDAMRRPFFGDTHVHTTYSFDANGQDTRNTPRDAYRFAKGERIGIQPYGPDGQARRSAQLRRPLDFTVISDHAELLGEIRTCLDPDAPGWSSDFCWGYRNFPQMSFSLFATRNLIMRERFEFCGPDGSLCLEQAKLVWRDVQSAAEEAYDRSRQCTFTSFVGYEWTATVGRGDNLHRNVVFRNAQVPELPTSWLETPSAYDLWAHLQQKCIDGVKGCDALTIPHNSNLSGAGLMFASARLTGPQDIDLPVGREEALLRQRWEPLVEIMQHKGDSECLPGPASNDELCGFEKLPYNSFAGVGRVVEQGMADSAGADSSTGLAPDRRGMVREALKKGLLQEQTIGANSLKYGIIASTDTHLGTPGLTMEDDAKGHGGAGSRIEAGLPDDLEFSPGGLAVLWSEENSRDALFAAMQRREAYGTSGTRPMVRFFGGWGFDESMCGSVDFARKGYSGGVPMGGDLPARAEEEGGPSFAVWAMQDPGTESHPGTPLERVQIVKGWIEGGEMKEKVVDVAGEKGRAHVDLATCEMQGEGARQLCSVWRDEAFDPAENAFYYARVLESPSCRWSQRLCVDAGVRCDDPATIARGFEGCCSPLHEPVIQERAWTSPIWYAP